MVDDGRYSLLTDILRTYGLSKLDIEEVSLYIEDLRSGIDATVPNKTSYRLRDHFLSPSEHSFFLVLRQATDGWAEVYPKVGLGSLFFSKIGDHTQYLLDSHLLHRIHVDFLLCRPGSLRPLLGVMLDARASHRMPKPRGQFVDQVFTAANVPLMHIVAERTYDMAELSVSLAHEAGLAHKLPEAKPEQLPPQCPKCGQPMALSVEPNANLVWKCASFPCCRTVLLFETSTNTTRN